MDKYKVLHDGSLYDPNLPEIMNQQALCLEKLYDFNATRPHEQEKRQQLLKEMFADRVAASKVYKGKDYSEDYPLEYLLTHRGKEMLHPESFAKLKEWLTLLKDKGEKETCKIIRKEKTY